MNVDPFEIERQYHLYLLEFIDKLETERPSLNIPYELSEYQIQIFIPLKLDHKLSLVFSPHSIPPGIRDIKDIPIIAETLLYKHGGIYNKLKWGYSHVKIWQGEPTLDNIKAILNEIDRLNELIDSETEEKKILCSKAITNI